MCLFRYEVVHWHETDEDEVVEVVARAIDVDGLFTDPVPVARERVVLRGCPREFADLAGDFALEVCVDDEAQWWDLTGLVVHGTVPNGDLVDVVASAAVRLDDAGSAFGPAPRHLLFRDDEQLGQFLGADGFPRPWHGHEWPPITLIGVEHPERVRPMRQCSHLYTFGDRLHALDRHGRVMAEVPIALDTASVTPSALGDGLFDVVLDQPPTRNPPRWRDRPAPSARAVWDLWREGVPAERNLWAPFDDDGREAWGDLTYLARKRFESDEVGGRYEVDGRYVTDWRSLHLALNEALVGPGGYCGREINALQDCLHGGWGVKPGFTLVWNDAQVAGDAIPDYLRQVVELMRDRGITVRLEEKA